jgi:hypothetical protein
MLKLPGLSVDFHVQTAGSYRPAEITRSTHAETPAARKRPGLISTKRAASGLTFNRQS